MDFLSGFLITEEKAIIVFNMLLSLIAGIIITGGYIIANKNQKYSKNFAITILLLPAIMAIVIPFIATDLKKTLSLAGIFALIRFRSIPGDSKDILLVFFSIAVGLIIGLCDYFLGFLMTIVVTLLFVLLSRKWKLADKQILKITIPEDMNYKDVFNDIFEKYLVKSAVKNVKTSNMGSLFTISYWIQPKADMDSKAFIDELRTRNGNLNIILENPDDMEAPVL
ncbi:MAG: DUF4956 domain-containing protein [Treponema sp.]|nr:DUF4956 domain-containing protein [Treponema sp.]